MAQVAELPVFGTRGALVKLQQICNTGASGELIAVSELDEIHVYVQGGRVAWATSRQTRLSFARYLITNCGIDHDTIREAIEEGKRTGVRVGETLVAWGICTEAQIRAALLSQIRSSLTAIDSPDMHTIFLPRAQGFKDYDEHLTFALTDVYGVDEAMTLDDASRSDQIIALLEDALWIDAVQPDGTRRVIQRLGAPVPAAERDLAYQLMDDHIQLVMIRHDESATLGVGLGEAGSVWCGLSGSTALGGAIRALQSHLVAQGDPADVGPTKEHGSNPRRLRGLAGVLTQTREVVGVTIYSGEEVKASSTRLANGPASQDELARRVQRVLQLDGTAEVAQDSSGDRANSILLRGRNALYGACHLGNAEELLWLTFCPSCSNGMAWALLTSLARQVRSL